MATTTIVAAPGANIASRPPRFKYLEWGAVIAGANVKVVQLSTKSAREVVSNGQGLFNLPSLVPGGS